VIENDLKRMLEKEIVKYGVAGILLGISEAGQNHRPKENENADCQ
jgi:hypothetical protein